MWPIFWIPVIIFSSILAAQTPAQSLGPRIRYTVSLKDQVHHCLLVKIEIPAGSDTHDLQLPVWNATYQVRDFSQFVNWVHAKSPSGQPLHVSLVDKSRWRISDAKDGANVEYEIVANESGPFGAELNQHHAFFNLAEVLMYPVDARNNSMLVRYIDVPAGWRAATALPGDFTFGFTAKNYDTLVDSPIELGTFQETGFDEGGSHYRIIVDADSEEINLASIGSMLSRIVGAETKWMNDHPFDTYVFLYHLPHESAGGGGMEHAFSTAITLSAPSLSNNPGLLADVSAHEFFHLWNVKRIRPQSLEPIDYTRENYTNALWFSEGFTSTVASYALLQAGFMDEPRFLTRLSATITALEQMPAYSTQSAEESSLDAWLEKYSYYRSPERSISYYDKGELIGVILDLQLREATHGAKSLRDLFQYMNQTYAKQGRFFDDSEGVRLAAETISGADFKTFFEKYVAGTEEIPWNQFFRTVGLQLAQVHTQVPDAGFSVTRNFNEYPMVSAVASDSEAEHAGLAVGDEILEVNGQPASRDLARRIAQMAPGDTLHIKIRNRQGERKLQWKLASFEREELQLQDLDTVMPAQKSRRAAWLKGEDEIGTVKP